MPSTETTALIAPDAAPSLATYRSLSGDEPDQDDYASQAGTTVVDVESYTEPESNAPLRELSWSSAYLLTVSRVLGSGIFATPGIILAAVGSPGLALSLWVAGAILAYLGLAIYLELGCMLPRSGGEKVYLEVAFPRPRYFTSILFAIYALVLGITASNCVIFAQYTLFALDIDASETRQRTLSLSLLTAITIIHAFFRRTGIWVQNALGWVKIGLMVFMIISGLAVVVFRPSLGTAALEQPYFDGTGTWWEGSIWSWGAIATSVLKIFYSFAGLSNVNNVLDEVRDPVRTVRAVSLAAFLTICCIYALTNVAYFLVVPLDEFKHSGELIAALFFQRIFGENVGRRFLPSLVALSSAGNVFVVMFALSRVKQEIARTGLLPFSRALSSTAPFGSPLGGLFLHYIPSALVLIIPRGDVYSFILEVENYAGQIIALAVSASLIWLRVRRPDLQRPFKAWLPGVWVRTALSVALLLAPFFPSEVQRTQGWRGIAYAFVGYAVFIFGMLYWLFFAQILPHFGRYKLENRTEKLADGTLMQTIVRVPASAVE